MTAHRVFKFHFTVDLHSAAGRKIAAAAQSRLRPGEIDNEWKDTVGRGDVGPFHVAISRTNTRNEWSVLVTTADDYDRAIAEALRDDVLAALQENAQEFKELPSELNPGG